MTHILGLDLSLTATGVAWEGGTRVLSFPKLRGMERVHAINLAVSELDQPDIVVLEGYSFGSKGRAVYDIAELGGVIRYGFHEVALPYVEVPPSVLKKFATGKGNVGKDEVLAAAIRKFGFEGSNNNEADAWILYKMGMARYDEETRSSVAATDYQREALAKVDWLDL